MDMDSFNRLLRPTVNRLRLMVGRGVLHMVNSAVKVQQMQASFLAGETRDGLEQFGQYGFTSNPLAGMEVVALFMGGDRSNGIVVGIGDRQYRLKGLKTGEVALYDDQQQSIVLTRDGIVIKGAGKPVTIKDTPKVRLETDLLEVTGEIRDRSDSGGQTMAAMRQVYNSHTHTENDSHGPTTAPNQGMADGV